MLLSQLNAGSVYLNNSAAWPTRKWRSRYDLAGALAGTNYIPCLSGPDTYTTYRNEPVIDGGRTSHGVWRGCIQGAREGGRGAPLPLIT